MPPRFRLAYFIYHEARVASLCPCNSLQEPPCHSTSDARSTLQAYAFVLLSSGKLVCFYFNWLTKQQLKTWLHVHQPPLKNSVELPVPQTHS
ncbi:hypothetical protein ASPSYDRAFT_47106 [Aspergillus sydowii CBS 593.65]|uniref:Uncharacterized protein n=1 Tax=Aspergillus sydowii CBS 593.65 TaxID=1036612 RepID=A0A1L9TBN2_9EURO|nr:uncharacterized protein ASPSYDRAFT_47106 [Aspergillus sydowii CBS 593.65]OJJ56832.1 hypothetical protein ASPSYDRAFT_47106 [Aspergillus sydowii CBS 593.65]